MIEPLLYETHAHTPLCKHATGQPEEYAEIASRRRLRGIVFTCHNPMPNGFSPHVRMAIDEFDEYVRIVDRARRAWADEVDVRLGLEADYFPGYEEWLEVQLGSADFHYVIGSVHPHLPEYRTAFGQHGPAALRRSYFQHLGDAAETGLFDCLAHPDIVKNLAPFLWEPDRIMDDVCRALDRIADTGVAMELNTSGTDKTVSEMNPFPDMLREMQRRSIPVVIGADAHTPERVGHRLKDALQLMEHVGYHHVSYFLDRQRHDIPIGTARASLHSSCRTRS